MANYDNKLGEWYKQLEKRAKEVAAKKRGTDLPSEPEDTPESVELTAPASQAPAASLEAAQSSEVVASVGAAELVEMTGDPRPVQSAAVEPPVETERPASAQQPASLFEDADISPVEDFLAFLNHSAPQSASAAPVVEKPAQDPLFNLTEGTGEPRPIVRRSDPVEEALPEVTPAPAPIPEPVIKQEAAPIPMPAWQNVDSAEEAVAQEKYDRLPQQLQALFSSVEAEVAQNSYKAFKESRASLIQRLLDPMITLEEAARILNVCPTTVRRYTNRGILPHLRTAGNQRRFKLSDVLGFMDSNLSKIARAGNGQAEAQ